jgi:hypothetical protein
LTARARCGQAPRGRQRSGKSSLPPTSERVSALSLRGNCQAKRRAVAIDLMANSRPCSSGARATTLRMTNNRGCRRHLALRLSGASNPLCAPWIWTKTALQSSFRNPFLCTLRSASKHAAGYRFKLAAGARHDHAEPLGAARGRGRMLARVPAPAARSAQDHECAHAQHARLAAHSSLCGGEQQTKAHKAPGAKRAWQCPRQKVLRGK